jgi:type II secretory pathway pseudopilin PulG
MFKNKFLNWESDMHLTGFTLVEIIISIIVISLLTAVLLANYHATNQRAQLNIVRQQIISDIRLAQNNSLGSKSYNGAIPQGGWGLYFDSRSSGSPARNTYYYFFADISSPVDNRYDDGEANPAYGGKTVYLPSGFTISEIRINNIRRNTLEITYEPPNPTVTICRPVQCDGDIGTITITDNSGQFKTITLNTFGLVDPN